MRNDIIRVYKAVHTWVGVIAALFLFVAFYGGAVTMFKEPLRRWAASPTDLPAAPSLEDTPELVRRALVEHPEARRSHTVHLEVTPAAPARLTWSIREPGADHHAEPRVFGASLDASGGLVVRELGQSSAAQFIDTLHRRVGLPIAEELAMPVTGVVSLLYFLALVSGVVVLAPTLAKAVLRVRPVGASVRRWWLDVHNTLGLLSLPFHLVIAFTALVFALHDEFYALQEKVLYEGRTARQAATAPAGKAADGKPDGGRGGRKAVPASAAGSGAEALATPVEIRARLAAEAPDFRLQRIEYARTPAGAASVRVYGDDVRQMLRGGTFGIGLVDPRTGALAATDYFPGRQPAGLALVTALFSLHFGNFGGTPIRWAYVALGLAGALLFYTGNLLWIEARRRRLASAASGGAGQPRSVRVLAALTVGVCVGTMAGVSATLAAARWMPAGVAPDLWHGAVHYACVVAALGWAFGRGAGRAGPELLWLCAACTLAIPLGTALCAATGLGVPPTGPLAVDLAAVGAAVVFAGLARLARRRALAGPRDSVWSAG